jgi:hypothetical protein
MQKWFEISRRQAPEFHTKKMRQTMAVSYSRPRASRRICEYIMYICMDFINRLSLGQGMELGIYLVHTQSETN